MDINEVMDNLAFFKSSGLNNVGNMIKSKMEQNSKKIRTNTIEEGEPMDSYESDIKSGIHTTREKFKNTRRFNATTAKYSDSSD